MTKQKVVRMRKVLMHPEVGLCDAVLYGLEELGNPKTLDEAFELINKKRLDDCESPCDLNEGLRTNLVYALIDNGVTIKGFTTLKLASRMVGTPPYTWEDSYKRPFTLKQIERFKAWLEKTSDDLGLTEYV